MRRLDRYIFKTVVAATLLTLLVLLLLEAFIGLLEELDNLKGGYDLAKIFQYLGLTLPRRTWDAFPIALLLGGLLGMGGLAASSEITAMRTAGLSVLRLVRPVLQAGLLLSLLALALGEFVAPYTEQRAQTLRANAKSEAFAIRGGQGFWARDGEYFIYVTGVLPGYRLTDIHIYEIDTDARLKAVAWAQQARYDDGRWILDQVNRSAIETTAVTLERFNTLTLNLDINPNLLELLAIHPEDLSMRDLHSYIAYLQNNGLDARSQQLAWWIKVFSPAINLSILYLAMPFVFAPQRSASRGKRLMIGICLGLFFFLFNRMLSNLVLLYNYPPVLGALAPALLFFAVGAYALRRVR